MSNSEKGPKRNDFEPVHSRLREIMLMAGRAQAVAIDEPGNLVLRATTIDPKTNQPGWFGTVTIKKSYVAYHLMPLHDDPMLAICRKRFQRGGREKHASTSKWSMKASSLNCSR